MIINKQLIILFVLLSITNTALPGEVNIDLRLVYSSNFNGEIKPCGCSAEGNLGGILRRASKLSTLKKSLSNTVFVSAGDILDKISEQNRIKADYMLEGHTYLDLDAILPGERDLAYPVKTLKKHQLPWVLTNKIKTLPFADHIERRLSSGKTVFIYGVVEPNLDKNIQRYLQPSDKILKRVLKRTKASDNDFVVLLVHGSESFANKFTKWPLIDIIVRGHLDGIVKKNNRILSAGYRGQRIGIADFNLQTKVQLLSNKVIPLTQAIPDHPKLTDLYTRYNNAVTTWWNKKTARIKISEHTDNQYTDKTCKTCHSSIYKGWKKTKHSYAINSLKQAGKQNDPECLVCHTTGMHKDGGFISINKTPERLNVQCGACHGTARNHANYPIANKLPNAFEKCVTCHTKENSPNFSMHKYWSQISHTLGTPPLHRQSISPIVGEYELLKPKQEIITSAPIEILEFFSFYCSRCYVFNSEFKKSHSRIEKFHQYKQIPITFGEQQALWASLAYVVAEQNGKGEDFKQAIFNAKFGQNADISDKQVVLKISKQFNLENKVAAALNDPDSKAAKKLQQYNILKKQLKIYATPTIVVNRNLRIMPKHTANNTNLMVENILEILQDIQCRKFANCINSQSAQ